MSDWYARYSHDLFYIAPLLHLGLPLIHRLIMIDVDLVFRKNILINIILIPTQS